MEGEKERRIPMRRVFVLVMALVLVGWLSSGVAWGQALSISIATGPSVDHVSIFVGVEKGVFAKHGLDAKLNLYPTGVEEINMRWIPGVELDVMKMAIRRSNYDSRMSKYTHDMYVEKAIPFLLGQKRLKQSFDPAIAIDVQFYLYSEKTAPQFYADLPPIPEAIRLK